MYQQYSSQSALALSKRSILVSTSSSKGKALAQQWMFMRRKGRKLKCRGHELIGQPIHAERTVRKELPTRNWHDDV